MVFCVCMQLFGEMVCIQICVDFVVLVVCLLCIEYVVDYDCVMCVDCGKCVWIDVFGCDICEWYDWNYVMVMCVCVVDCVDLLCDVVFQFVECGCVIG